MHIKGQPPPKKVADRELITNTTIYECIAAPHPADIKLIRDTLLETSDITSCLSTINMLKASKGLALADILTALGEELSKIEVPPQTRVTWLEGLAEVEYRLSGGGSETVQTGGLVGVVRQGMIPFSTVGSMSSHSIILRSTFVSKYRPTMSFPWSTTTQNKLTYLLPRRGLNDEQSSLMDIEVLKSLETPHSPTDCNHLLVGPGDGY